MKNEIIIYNSKDLIRHIEVIIDEKTVWLNQEQLVQLFQRDESVISRHIRNIFREGELDEKSNMQKMHIADSDKPVTYYNLDVIISIGYRVKSKQGTQFRIWATNVLRDYLLKGYAFNQRINRIENNIENLTSEVRKISLQLKTQELPIQGVFFDGEIFDSYELTSRLIRSAKSEIILIDNYINESTLVHLSKKAINVRVLLYTKTIDKQLLLDVKKMVTPLLVIPESRFPRSGMRNTDAPAGLNVFADSLHAHSIGNFFKLIDGVVGEVSDDWLTGTGVPGGSHRESAMGRLKTYLQFRWEI